MKNKIAFVVFAKTPGITPAKTRLAAEIGVEKSEKFYLTCCEELKKDLASVNTLEDVSVYISIAEEAAKENSYWEDFNIFNQPPGGLGEKLHATYEHIKLKENFERVIFLGVDSPQLGLGDYLDWIDEAKANRESLLGPALDGGFYMFSPLEEVAKDFWLSIKYSDSKTCDELIIQLDKRNMKYKLLAEDFDVDYKKDLDLLKKALLIKEGFKKPLLDYLNKINI